jgi:hypothetical protein
VKLLTAVAIKPSRLRWLSFSLLAAFLAAGCRREPITAYRVPKESEPMALKAQGEETTPRGEHRQLFSSGKWRPGRRAFRHGFPR